TAGTGQPGAGSRTSITEPGAYSAAPAEDGTRTSGALAAPGARRGRPAERRAGETDAGEPASALVGQLLNWKFLLSVLGVLALLVASLLTGVYDIFGGDGGAEMFQITRVPRTIALVLAGAAMAMCGPVVPVLAQDRVVEPTTTGATAGAGL